jgi:hypothetical protein
MFDGDKKQKALDTLGTMCHQCGSNHSDECPLAKAMTAVNLIPTQE